MLLATLGMFIIGACAGAPVSPLTVADEFTFDDAARQLMKPPDGSGLAMGGGGTYAAIGGRMWASADQIGMIVDRGLDWPAEVQTALDSFGPMWLYRDDASRGTTRARNIYTGETRGFEYLTQNRPQLNPSAFVGTRFYGAKWLHAICSPTRMVEMLAQLDDMTDWSPRLCYEPVPFACKPEELDALRAVLPRIDLFSPNHEEAAAFYSTSATTPAEIETLARRFVEDGAKDVVIIRAGARGACCTRREWSDCRWVPAFHAGAGVVDVTGAGNSFLGGAVVGLERTGDVLAAARYGAVSASFTIEQWGLPTLKDGLWNGQDPRHRLRQMEHSSRGQ